MNKAVEFGGMKVEPGTTRFGSLSIAQRPVTSVALPLTVVNGTEAGPTFSITAGIHACEYNGIVACMRLAKEIAPHQLKGTLVMVPVVNLPSFESRTPFVNPIDGTNINRVFPGKKNGTISEQIAYAVHYDVIRHSNYYVDFHSGDLIEAIPPHTCAQRVGDAAVDGMSEKLARLFDCEILNIMGKGIDDLNATEDEQGTYFAGLQSGLTSVGNAALAGIPSVLIEAGGAGVLDPKVVQMDVDGIKHCLRHLGMLEGKPKEEIPHKVCYGMYIMKSGFGGIFFPDVAPGDFLKKGQRIGEMQSIRGEVLATFSAPLTGVVLMMYTTPVRSSGETVLIMGRTDEP